MTKLTKFACLILFGSLSCAGPVWADAVTDWNDIANVAVATGRPGPSGALDLALVQAAVHDAVQALDRRHEPYFAEVPGASGSLSAAVAAAAHDVLVAFYPSQAVSLDISYSAYLANNGLSGDPGLVVGQKVSAMIVPLRRLVPSSFQPFIGGTNAGQWRPTESFLPGPPASFSAMAVPWMAESDPFTLTGPARFRAEPPPALTDNRYRIDYDEVKAYGSLVSAARSAQQTDVAYFWSENFLAQWNRALRAIAINNVPRQGDRARLFALANLAVADALISAWDSKKFYFIWRPLTAIREGNSDGNPNTVGDQTWQPLINNPNYPDYTSGANNVTGAMTQVLALFFRTDRMTFQVTSNAPLAVQKTRTYNRFSDAAQEVVDARVYLGIHFRFADTAARTQGRQVARWVVGHYLLPRDNDRHDDGHHDDDHRDHD
jgi:PAP2 superfamily